MTNNKNKMVDFNHYFTTYRSQMPKLVPFIELKTTEWDKHLFIDDAISWKMLQNAWRQSLAAYSQELIRIFFVHKLWNEALVIVGVKKVLYVLAWVNKVPLNVLTMVYQPYCTRNQQTSLEFWLIHLQKCTCRSRSDHAEHSIWLVSTLSALCSPQKKQIILKLTPQE